MKKKIYLLALFLTLLLPFSLMATDLTLEAKGAILMEAKTGTILYEKKAYSKFYPASMTKLLTALIIEEQLPVNTVITKSQSSVNVIPNDSSEIGLKIGDKYNKVNGLYGLLLGSDNFIAHDLALATSGTISKFADLMNAKAQAIGAQNTHFVNPHGYHDPNHYTTPYDMALIAKAAFSNPTIQKIAGTEKFNFYVSNKNKYIPIKNTSRLIKPETPYYNPAVVATKTGFHDAAGQTLASKAIYGDMELIAVVMYEKTPNQYIDINKLFDYATTNYSIEKVNESYILKNKMIPSWAEVSIARATTDGWINTSTNYSGLVHTEDLISILNKIGTSYETITMQEIDELLGLKQGDLVTRSDFAQLMTFASNKWGINLTKDPSKLLPSDTLTLPASAQAAICYMIDHDFMRPLNSLFYPERTITFAEMISTLDRMLP